jgi:hypothetical protein
LSTANQSLVNSPRRFAMYESLLSFPGGLLAEFERLQRELQQEHAGPGRPGSIRAVASGAFPALNVGSTASSIEVYAFAPSINPAKLDLQIDRGHADDRRRTHERPAGRQRQPVDISQRALLGPPQADGQPVRRRRPIQGRVALPQRRAAHRAAQGRACPGSPYRGAHRLAGGIVRHCNSPSASYPAARRIDAQSRHQRRIVSTG